jgi:hypothetical protein
MDLSTVVCAMLFARWIVTPIAMPTTIKIRTAINTKSLSASGNFGRSVTADFFFG